MRRSFVAVAIMVMTASGVVPGAAGVAGAELPVVPLVWAGQVVDDGGDPVEGAAVEAALRLAPSALPADAPQPGLITAIPLASSVTGPGGMFELRSPLLDVPPAFLADGWAHVVVSALAPDGSWSLALDSMRYIPGPDGIGLWATTDQGAEQARRLLSAKVRPLAVSAFEAAELSAPDQRPERLVLNPPQEPRAAVPFSVGPGEPYRGCTSMFTEGPPKNGFRTVADIDIASDWSFEIHYKETDTTAWEVGYEKPSPRGGVEWGVAGSRSFNNRVGRGYDTQLGPYPHGYQQAFQIQLEHVKVVWRCGDRRSPGPFYVRTVEPRRWTGGTYNREGVAVRCNPKFRLPVSAGTYQYREQGKSSKYSASGNVWGFNGRASVEYSKTTTLGWKNHLGTPRHLCGESADPYEGRTRVVTLPS